MVVGVESVVAVVVDVAGGAEGREGEVEVGVVTEEEELVVVVVG